jgi:hypothetical protein
MVGALIFYAFVWGLVVETADRLLGDPFEPLDVVTLALQIAVAIVLWPFFRRLWGARAED